MFGTTRGMLVPARKHLFAVALAVIASVPVTASADPGMVDARTLPRLEGAEAPSRNEYSELTYGAPTSVAVTTANTRAMLATAGWAQYLRPLYESDTMLHFKKGKHGFDVSFKRDFNRPDQSTVSYSSDQLLAELPFPDGATNVFYDHRRAYLNCVAPGTVDANLDFFRDGLIEAGWSPLSATDIAMRWPNARLDETITNGARAYYSRPVRDSGYRHPPIMLSLQKRSDGTTSVEIKTAPFVLPQNLELGRETGGLPIPNLTAGFGSEFGSKFSKVHGAVEAELPVVLAFFRRELGVRNWKEETRGAVETPDQIVLNFSSPDQTATLRLKSQYDLTIINLTTQVTEAGLAARAKAKKEADAKFFSDAATMAKEIIAADEVRRVAQAANLSDAPLRSLADNKTPVPLPETAENVQFEGADGRLEFEASASVKAVATFYRASLKSAGWTERPSVINHAAMVVMEFSKDRKSMSFTVMQMGPKAKISAHGSALVTTDAKMAYAKPGAAGGQASSGAATKAAVQVLEVDPETDADAPFPMPKQRGSTVSRGSGKLPGSNVPFRRELEISVPADLASVLAFYRTELGKRGWKESAERAVMQADRVQLTFTSPDGPAQLKLGRAKDETTVSLAQKYTEVAAKAGVMPKPGLARLVFGNMGGGEAAVTINKQTIKLAAGAGGPQSQKPPMLDLPPGKYTYSVKVAGRPARNDTVEVTADDAWGLMIAPSGEALSLQMY